MNTLEPLHLVIAMVNDEEQGSWFFWLDEDIEEEEDSEVNEY